MKSSTGFRIAVVTALCVQPFLACTNDDVDFAMPGVAGSPPHAGSAGNGSSSAGSAQAGSAAGSDDAGSAGNLGEGGEAGAAGSGDAGSGSGGVNNTGGQGGNAGHGGTGRGGSAGTGGNAIGGGGRAGNGAGGAGTGGAAGATGAGGSSRGGTGGSSAGMGGSAGAGISGASAGGSAGASPVCGNAVLEKGEQCDDGNTNNLDACSASCAFEQSQRANSIEQKFKTSSLCPKNAFGTAFEGVAQTALQAVLDQRVESGSLSLLFAFRGLRDLSGMSPETIMLGMAYGTPSAAPSYDGKNDLDWWYTPATGQVDETDVLYSNSTGFLSDGVLEAAPDSLRIPLFSDLPIYVSNIKVRLFLGDSSTPLASSGNAPGHLANEHLRPGLVSFASGGPPPPANGDPGQLCGGLSAGSLSGIAIPAAYATGGASACIEGYSSSRSLLDLLVGGCNVGTDELVAATQPDQADPGAPVGGAGAPYRLSANAITNAVTGCRDKANNFVALATCLNAAAYSTAYRLKTGRAIIKR